MPNITVSYLDGPLAVLIRAVLDVVAGNFAVDRALAATSVRIAWNTSNHSVTLGEAWPWNVAGVVEAILPSGSPHKNINDVNHGLPHLPPTIFAILPGNR